MIGPGSVLSGNNDCNSPNSAILSIEVASTANAARADCPLACSLWIFCALFVEVLLALVEACFVLGLFYLPLY